MALELSGKIFQVLPEQSGTGKNGQWSKQDFVLETEEQYPRKVCFSAWGDKVQMLKSYTTGSYVKVSFNAESREFNGKWYTDLKVWKFESAGQPAASQAPEKIAEFGLEPLSPIEANGAMENDLPF
jgi:hypothetical protein